MSSRNVLGLRLRAYGFSRPAMIILLLACASCAHQDSPTAPVSPSPKPFTVNDVPALLTAAAGMVDALPKQTAVACVTADIASAVLKTTAEAIAKRPEIPSVHVDVSACGLKRESPPEATSIAQAVAVVGAALPLAAVVADTQVTDCTAKAWVNAASSEIQNLAPVVTAEVNAPDGVVDVPALPVDVSGCL